MRKRGINAFSFFLILLCSALVLIVIIGIVNKEIRLSPEEKTEMNAESLSEVNIFDKQALEERKNFISNNGKEISLTGTSEVFIFDDFENWRSETQYFLRDAE